VERPAGVQCPHRMTDDHPSSLGEEIASSVSHGVGVVAGLAAAPWLVLAGVRRDGAAGAVGASVFAATVVLLYLASTLYHALPPGRAKRVFRVLDHSAIYLLIAGTYTPFMLGVIRGPLGWTLLGAVWTLAVAGIALKGAVGIRYPRLSTAVYIAMGWLAIVAIRPLWPLVPVAGWLWIFAGGAAYTAGVAFYAARRLRYGHFIWHLFVLAGTACHVVAVWRYAF
jgi:hemolysin III